jgi:hypothetical protein
MPMTKRAEIKCVNKDDRLNPYERIINVGGFGTSQWKISLAAAIQHVESQEWEFYVRRGGHDVDVVVAVSRSGNKYLKTKADGDTPDNLLSLPECP